MKFTKWLYQWFWDELPVKNSKFTKKVFCSKCKHYFFDYSIHDSGFRCRQPCTAKYKSKTKDNPINQGSVVLTLSLAKDAWKINKNNNCTYYKEA